MSLKKLIVLSGSAFAGVLGFAQDRPNILWLTTEDMSSNHLSCYGNVDIKTPNIDAFASKGIRFTNAYSNAPISSPARTTIITGMYSSSLMAEYHRMERIYPWEFFYPITLRKAGYYCTNSGKTDYNSVYDVKGDQPVDIWDSNKISSLDKLNVPVGKPFFAVINFFETHMSRVTEFDNGGTLYNNRKFTKVDPSTVHFATYLPHTDTIKNDMAWHLEKTLELDAWFGKQIKILKDKGLADNTIVFFYSDHGGCLPGSKGYLREEGVKVPLIVYFPPKWAHLAAQTQPATEGRFVSFVDLAPTIYSLLGIPKPSFVQGKAFAGKNIEKGNDGVYLYKANQEQNFIPARGFTDGKYKIIWNYNTAYTSGGRNSFQWGMPGMRDWEEKQRAGNYKSGYPDYFFEQLVPIEFYDLSNDPNETVNLANDIRYSTKVTEYKKRVMNLVRQTGDMGFFPPSMRDTINTYEKLKAKKYKLEPLVEAAELASTADLNDIPKLTTLMKNNDTAIRFWAATGFFQLAKRNKIKDIPEIVSSHLNDISENDDVRLMCAGALIYSDKPGNALEIAFGLFKQKKQWAYAFFQNIGDKAKPVMPEILKIYNNGVKNFDVRSALINGGVIPYNQLFTKEITPNVDVKK